MEKPFRPLPLSTLARWIFRDLDESETVLGIPKANFKIPAAKLAMTRMGKTFASPLGVAAGPHTQLAQNIIAAWLVGGRFIELKTVQVLDTIHVSKPCIDSEDATFNCEWSQELTLDQSFDEYLKAWVLLHAIAHKMGLASPGVFFSMSVGYNLEGILSPTVQRFLDRMSDASKELAQAIDEVAAIYPPVRDLAIPTQLSDQITLSTMHGCPPSEIEKIASYLIAERGVHTMVKLNPTLIGPERLRKILNEQCGFDIEVPDIAFEHDPKFDDAMAMIRNLKALAKGRANTFGIKLSNTLEVVNGRPVFPANEKMMYMSGRSLHPITLSLAHRVTEELDGDIAISFCGGADADNYVDLIADGLGPVTLCSDLLKPGGYARMGQFLDNLEAAMTRHGVDNVDDLPAKVAGDHKDGARGNLARHVARVLDEKRFLARERPMDTKGKRPLSYFDCSSAPCQEACPAHQDVPEYLRLVAAGKTDAALDVILATNALPCATGNVCTHPCMTRCVRNHCDEPVQIRAIKRFAAEHGKASARAAAPRTDLKVAIIGAGPAGLSAASYLADLGVQATIFEAHQDLGGMVASVIPAYRLTREALKSDLDRIAQKGVEVKFGQKLGDNISIEGLKKAGFDAIFLGIGAAAGKKLGIDGEGAQGVLDALVFLDKAKKGESMDLGDKVLVVGAGNSAMDAARTARRLVKNGSVDIVYRRTRAQMPADPEEVEACVEEKIGLKTLLAPKSVQVEDGRATALVCEVMKLGEKDQSGRARPEPTGQTQTIPCTAIISAISQAVVVDFTTGTKIEVERGAIKVNADGETGEANVFAGGDAVHGPASVIQGIADGRAFAMTFARRHGLSLPARDESDRNVSSAANLVKKAVRTRAAAIPTRAPDARDGFDLVHDCLSEEAARAEASRCLECDKLCNICVTVCPNRANQAYRVGPMALTLPRYEVKNGALSECGHSELKISHAVQTFNLADSCNECGNCQTFCPTAGAPYQDKPRVWLDREGFEEGKGDRFHFHRVDGALELIACLDGALHRLTMDGSKASYVGPSLSATLDLASGTVDSVKPSADLGEGTTHSLDAAGKLAALFAMSTVLPV